MLPVALVLALLGSVSALTDDLTQTRVAVVRISGQGYTAFRPFDGQLLSTHGSPDAWKAVPACPGGRVVSNAVALITGKSGGVFVQAEDGQVYCYGDVGATPSWSSVGTTKLPADTTASADMNSLVAVFLGNSVHVFVKTMEKSARLYWSQSNGTGYSDWVLVGGNDQHLSSPPAVAVNYFTKRLEAVAVMTNGDVYHTWQESPTSFHSWDKLGLFEPEFVTQSAPQLHSNHGDSIFNGRLELFIYGRDGYVHHVAQTTCDKVKNPWGPCTWGFYEKLTDHSVPSPLSNKLPIVIATNVHGGLELFTVDTSHQLWQLWQVEQGKRYEGWTRVQGYAPASPPSLYEDGTGYWHAYALDASLAVLDIHQNLSFRLTPHGVKVPSGKPVNVSWSVPQDEATNADWIGVYQPGAPNDAYLDFVYVQGKQNPLHDTVPVGTVSLRSFLPDGDYDYRYLVNRQFVDVISSKGSFYNGSTAPEGTQLYHGIAVGLGKENLNLDTCVEDANHTIEVFRESFEAFENREIVKGLQLFGEGLKDVKAALVACEETDIAKQLEKFIDDLIQCTQGKCVHFIIDVIGELVSVLYENIHEIYGDIRGAKNCFKIKAYEQGGLCVGRVVAACIEGPSF